MSDAGWIALFNNLPMMLTAVASIVAAVAAIANGRKTKAIDEKTDRIEVKADAAVESTRTGEAQNRQILASVDGNLSRVKAQVDALQAALAATQEHREQLTAFNDRLLAALEKVAPARVVVAPGTESGTTGALVEGRRVTDALRSVPAKPDENA